MRHHLPTNGVGKEQMGKHFSNIAQFVRVQTMDRVVRVPKDLLKRRNVGLVDLTKSLQ